MRIVLIHNPAAGYDQADGPKLLELLTAAGHQVVYQSTQVDDLGAALDMPVDLIAVAGGDGTVTSVMCRCAGRDTPLAILPLGTANNLATSLGHSGTLEELIQSWRLDQQVPIDLGLAIAEWGRTRFAETVGVGLLAETIVVADRGNEEKARAAFKTVVDRLTAGLRVMRKTLKNVTPSTVRLQVHDQVIEGEFLWAEVSTVGAVGPRIVLSEMDDPSDGQLVYALLPVEERDTFDEYLDARQSGRAPTRTGLVVGRAPSVQFEFSGGNLHIDGRLIRAGAAESSTAERPPSRLTIEAIPAAVRLLGLRR